MKKYLSIIASLLVLILTLTGCATNVAGQKTEKEQKVIRVGATGLNYPNAYKEGDKLVGFDVEVIETAAKNLGYIVEWTTTDLSGLFGQLESGKIDTIANQIAANEERKKKYNFTEPYSYVGSQVVTNKDNADINSLDDLKGKTVAGVLGSNHINKMQEYGKDKGINVKAYETPDVAISDAVSNRVDGYINGKPVLLAEIAKKNLPLKLVGDPISYVPVAFPFNKDEKSQELLSEFDEEIQRLREDGTLKALSEKYFNADITVESE